MTEEPAILTDKVNQFLDARGACEAPPIQSRGDKTMALQPVLESVDGVDVKVLEHYVEKDGTHYLELTANMPGFEPKAKVDEFRDTSTRLKGENEELTTKLEAFDGVDVEEYKRLKNGDGVQKVFDDDEHNRRVEGMRTEHGNEVGALKTAMGEKDTKLAERDSELDRLVIRNGIQTAATAEKPKKGAMVDIINRLEGQFIRKDGKAVRVELRDGKPEIKYGPDGEPGTIAHALAELKAGDGHHLFEGSTGDNANNDGGDGGANAATISAEDARDTRKYRAAKERAAKAGQVLRVVD